MIRGQTSWQRNKKHGPLRPMHPRDLADAMGDYAAIGNDDVDVAPVLSWRSAGVVAVALFAGATLLTFVNLIGA